MTAHVKENVLLLDFVVSSVYLKKLHSVLISLMQMKFP